MQTCYLAVGDNDDVITSRNHFLHDFRFSTSYLDLIKVWPWAIRMMSSNQEITFFTTSGSPRLILVSSKRAPNSLLSWYFLPLMAGSNILPSIKVFSWCCLESCSCFKLFSNSYHVTKFKSRVQKFSPMGLKPDGVNHLGGNSPEQPPPVPGGQCI